MSDMTEAEFGKIAAVLLRVPDSGEAWLDAMIRQSLRQEFGKIAAILLKVPDSGHPWLDAMIREARRMGAAQTALQTMKLANSWSDNPLYWEGVARSAVVAADALMAELEKKGGE